MKPQHAMGFAVAVVIVLAAASATTADEPPSADFGAVPIVKSPVVMKGIYGSRSSSALESFGTESRATEGAILRALRWLKSVQNPDGSWGGDADAFDAATALALLTFMGHGETTTSDEFGEAFRKGLNFLVADMKQPGRLECKGQPPAYGHGISTWAVCEAHGMTRIPMLMGPAQSGLEVILKGQRESGLWDLMYRTDKGQDDVEASVWQVFAVKAGLMMGSELDGLRDCLRRAADGMEKVLVAGTNTATTAAAVYCLQLAGRWHTPACRAASERLAVFTPDWDAPAFRDPVFRWYLMSRARFHHGGKSWMTWNRAFRPLLITHQVVAEGADGKNIGYWQSPGGGERYGRVYATALSTMALEIFGINRLPSFQPIEPPLDEGEDDEDIEIRIEI